MLGNNKNLIKTWLPVLKKGNVTKDDLRALAEQDNFHNNNDTVKETLNTAQEAIEKATQAANEALQYASEKIQETTETISQDERIQETVESSKKAIKSGVDLQLSGHTHAGQIPPMDLLVQLIYKYPHGLYKNNGSYIYTSWGTGIWGPPMRLLSRSEIVSFTVARL